MSIQLTPTFYIPKLILVGVGLIGGSLVRSLRLHQAVGEVVGVGRGEANLKRAVKLGILDRYYFDAGDAVAAEGGDLLVIATPVNTTREVLEQLVPHLPDAMIITDVGSTKISVIADAKAVLGAQFGQFIPAHPIAGRETSGADAAIDDLYVNHKLIVTPTGEERPQSVAVIEAMWRLVGANVVRMNPADHDSILAVTSHLPHILAYALVDFLSQKLDSDQYFDLAAGGFYDFTRIASSDPVMWRDISLSNQKELVAQIKAFQAGLSALSDMIEKGDGDALAKVFDAARQTRARVADRRN